MPRTNGVLSQPSTSRTTRGRVDPSPPQPSRSQQRATQNDNADDADYDQMVINLVKTILNLSVNKHPMKKADLVKIALGGNGRIFPKIIEQVMSELAEVYGYKLIETDRNKAFILVSTITCSSIYDVSEDYMRKYTLLYLILGYIFMKSGEVPEQGLWDFLAKLNITNDGEHNYFGNVQKFIGETFIKQAYLVRKKQIVEGMNDDRYFFTWGVRSEHELSKKDILESICKLMGKPSICYITQHTAAYNANDDGDDQMDDSQD